MEPARGPRILVVSPFYFPREEGLAHYTTEFCRHLAKRASVAVLTGVESAGVERGPGSVEVFADVRRWTLLGVLPALIKALRFEPDRVLFQFVPLMYARGGVNFGIVAVAGALAARARVVRRGAVQVMFHELWHPFGKRPFDKALHLVHRSVVLGMTLSARDALCSTTLIEKQVRRNLGVLPGRVRHLAVGSNLEREGKGLRERPTPSRDVLKIGLFGSLHVSKNVPLTVRALHEAWRKSPRKIEVTILGLTFEDLVGAVPELSDWLSKEVRLEGHLDSERAAECIARQDFLVCYFQDGISSRRGSLLAALCEGVPVATTWTETSDPVFLGRPFVKLLPAEERAFSEELVRFASSPERPFDKIEREAIRRFYDEHFSWAVIVEKYLELTGISLS